MEQKSKLSSFLIKYANLLNSFGLTIIIYYIYSSLKPDFEYQPSLFYAVLAAYSYLKLELGFAQSDRLSIVTHFLLTISMIVLFTLSVSGI